MKEQIEAYAKLLKLSWIREHYQKVKAHKNDDNNIPIFEKEIKKREKRKVKLLLKQLQITKTGDQLLQWEHIQNPQGINLDTIHQGEFIKEKENLILYGEVGTGK